MQALIALVFAMYVSLPGAMTPKAGVETPSQRAERIGVMARATASAVASATCSEDWAI